MKTRIRWIFTKFGWYFAIRLHRIHIGDDWLFATGGEFRFRYYEENNSRLSDYAAATATRKLQFIIIIIIMIMIMIMIMI